MVSSIMFLAAYVSCSPTLLRRADLRLGLPAVFQRRGAGVAAAGDAGQRLGCGQMGSALMGPLQK